MATGGISDEENKAQKETMKTSGMKNGMKSFDNDLRYGSEDYQTSLDYKKEHSSGEEDEDDEISVGCPSPIQERYAAEAGGYKSEDEEEEEENDYRRRLSSPPSSVNSNNAHPSSSDEHSSTSTTINCTRQSRNCSSEDEDSERLQDDDYFKPLKKLKMIQIDKVSYSISGNNRSKSAKRAHQRIQQQQNQEATSVRRQSLTEEVTSASAGGGVKSFSILDILNHRPLKGAQRLEEPKESVVNTRIVRPWDYGNLDEVAGSSCIPPPAHRGLIPPPPMLIDRFHHRVHHMRPKSADFCSSYDTSTCSSSGRSSTGGSDCCTSPDIINCTVSSPNPVHGSSHRRSGHQAQTHSSQRKSSGGGGGGGKTQTPLDALFQMTSKTFEELNGEASTGKSSYVLHYSVKYWLQNF